MKQDATTDDPEKAEPALKQTDGNVICPVCGAIAVQEKCKMICHSPICRGRVVMNCSEF